MKAKLTKGKEDSSVISTLEAELSSDVKFFIPSLLPGVDEILGGGWPVGRIAELFGPEGAGKSALTHLALLSTQQQGGLPIYIDWEGSMEKKKMDQLGIRPKDIVHIKPADCEQAWSLIWNTMDEVMAAPVESRPKFVTVVWDSVAATISKKEADDSNGEKHTNFEVAKQMSRGVRKAYLIAPKVGVFFLFVNQERTQIGGMTKGFGGPPKTTPGGDALKFACTLRVRCSRIETLKEGTRASGQIVKAVTKKNKVAPPFQTAEWIIDYKRGPSPAFTTFRDLLQGRVLKLATKPKAKTSGPVRKEMTEEGLPKASTVYLVPWHPEPLGRDAFLDLFTENKSFRAGALKAWDVMRSVAVKDVEPPADGGDEAPSEESSGD